MERHYDNLNRKTDSLQMKHNKRGKHPQNSPQQTFHPRTVNLTDITFTREEQELLDLGLQHNLQQPTKTYWTNLIIEIDRAIRMLDPKIQDSYHIMATKKLKQMHNTHHNINSTHKRQQYIAKNIHHKINKNNVMIAQADKGKTTVIIHKQDYHNKVHNFLLENNFQPLPNDPIKKDKALITKILRQCHLIIPKTHIQHLTQKHPAPPSLKAQLKLHKPGIPIRPVVNNRTTPSYKVAKKLNGILKQHLNLDNLYTVNNSAQLAHALTKLNIHGNHRLITLDIKDLYVNIPIKKP
jgi:hypothetical protein